MNIPDFTAEASLYTSVKNYRMRGVFGQSGKALGIQAMARIRIRPLPCPLICELFFENGVLFERCRFECPPDGGGGDGESCLTDCKNMGGSDEFCEQMCIAGT
jgi:hypothetical protein